jgi:pantetheine-phosphate adenylyltransferase
MSQRHAIYPGSFDPVTVGHIDIIRRAAGLFDSLIVAVAHNESKSPLFDVEARLAMLEEAVGDVPGVIVKDLEGLLVDFARKEEAFVVIRGLRAVSDFEFEFQMALMNRRLEARLETVFLAPREDCTFLSSRIVKEIARFGGDVDSFVPASVARQLREKFLKS